MLSNFRNFLQKFAKKPEDSKDETFKKLLILIIALSCSICGILWSLLYLFVFGFGVIMLLPLSFVIIVGSAIFISHRLANHHILIYTQLFCITWISAFIQWSIGSIDNSGLVIAWSFLGPLGALIFLSIRDSIMWMLMFIIIIIISAIIEPALLGKKFIVSEPIKTLFYIMNMGTSTTVVFAASTWFAKTIQLERNRSDNLLTKIQSLFGQHVSKEVAEELVKDKVNTTGAKYFDVTIMFLDIRNFTKLVDSRAPQEVANFQNIVFSELINIVRENKGIVLQILGDGIMAVFGAPVVSDKHAEEAVLSSFSIIEKSKELSEHGKIPPIRLGIGLHSGQVIAGEVGNDFRKFYSLAGSNVIVAARVEQLNKEYNSQLLITETVESKIRHLNYSAKDKGQIALKGISNPIRLYQLI